MKILNHNQFNEIKNKEGIKVVDFFADWCGPCKMLSPVLEQLSEEMDESVEFIKINIDENLSLAQEYGITTIPTLIYLKDGKEQDRTIGFIPKDNIKDKISSIK